MIAPSPLLNELRDETSDETADKLTDAVIMLFGDRTDLDACAATAIRWTQTLNGAQFIAMVGRVSSEVGLDAATAITRRCDWAPTRSSRGNPEQLVVERLAGTLEAIGMTVRREVTNDAGRCDLVAESGNGMRPVFASPTPSAEVRATAAAHRVAVFDVAEPREVAATVAAWLGGGEA